MNRRKLLLSGGTSLSSLVVAQVEALLRSPINMPFPPRGPHLAQAHVEHKPGRPARREKPRGAGVVVARLALELDQRGGKIRHGAEPSPGLGDRRPPASGTHFGRKDGDLRQFLYRVSTDVERMVAAYRHVLDGYKQAGVTVWNAWGDWLQWTHGAMASRCRIATMQSTER